MSTIEERIEKHKQQLMNAEKCLTKHAQLREKWEEKYRFYMNAIVNLEAKKAKHDKKVN